jgi:hypothetical protein
MFTGQKRSSLFGSFLRKVLGKITSLLSATFRPIFIAINRKNSRNSFVTLYIQRDLNENNVNKPYRRTETMALTYNVRGGGNKLKVG